VLAPPLGRPVCRSPREARNGVIRFLDEHGPHVGVPTLRLCFPAMRRAELAGLLRRYRRAWRRRNRVPLRVLSWPVAGSVWAIDFTGPLKPVEDRYTYLLAVRDLSTGYQLLWLPVAAATGEVARDALAALFAEHGPPLVLKCDNGSPFTGAVVGQLLAGRGVFPLYSPPYWPRYNGAVEAGIGSLKDRTDAQAARAGHAGYWTWDAAAGARAEANVLARPRGPRGPSPDELWGRRLPITAAQRDAFRCRVGECRSAPAAVGSCAGVAEAVGSGRAVARCAIRLALEGCGYLQYRRRSIPPPI
jgi:transposase InsO family protein